MKVHKEIPISEITLRKFEKPYGDLDSCLRKFLMSVGLLQVGESRDDLTRIFRLLFLSRKAVPGSDIIRDTGVSPSNVRRHLRRLKGLGFVEKVGEGYRISEGKTLREIVSDIKPALEMTIDRIIEYADFLETSRSQKDSSA